MMNTPRSGFNGYRKPPRNDEKAAKLITPRHVMNALRKWWLLAIPIGLLAAATAAALIINTFEPQYMASAWLKIESDQPFVAFPERADSRVFVANQIELIRSPLVLDPVISLPEIARIPEIQESKDPVAWLPQHIQVRSVGGSDLFTISFTCSDGHDAARVVNAIYNAYSAQRGDEEVKRTQRVLDLLKEEQGRRQLELTRLQENVRELAKQAIIKDPLHGRTAANELVQNPLAALQQQRSEREVEVEVLKAKVAAITESFAEKPVEEIGVPAGDLEKAISEDPRIKALETGLAIRQERLRDYAAKLTGYKQDPNYLALAREIDAEKERIAKYREELRPAVEAAYRQSLVQKRQEEVAAMQSQLESLQLAKQMLDERYRREIDTLKQATGESLDVEFMRADLERAGEVYDLITSRILKIETEMRAPERVVLLKEAEPVLNPTTEYPWKPLLLGVVAAFLAPFGLAIGWERLVERISHSEQIEEEAQLPIIGEIASLPRARRVAARAGQQRETERPRLSRELRQPPHAPRPRRGTKATPRFWPSPARRTTKARRASPSSWQPVSPERPRIACCSSTATCARPTCTGCCKSPPARGWPTCSPASRPSRTRPPAAGGKTSTCCPRGACEESPTCSSAATRSKTCSRGPARATASSSSTRRRSSPPARPSCSQKRPTQPCSSPCATSAASPRSSRPTSGSSPRALTQSGPCSTASPPGDMPTDTATTDIPRPTRIPDAGPPLVVPLPVSAARRARPYENSLAARNGTLPLRLAPLDLGVL